MRDKEVGLPKKYFSGLSDSTAKARKAHWKKMEKYSDKDPRAYEPAPGDATAKTKESKYTKKYKEMFGESSDKGLAAKASKSGVSLSTLRKVYRRGVAAWNSGHRPGTTPQQWGMARVNSYITKGKTYYTADKDLREKVLEVGTPETLEFHKEMTPGEPSKKGKTLKEIRNNSKKKKPRFQAMAPFASYFDSRIGSVPSGGIGLTAYKVESFSNEENLKLEEAIQYHIENEISFTENVFRPGSRLFFEMISTAKELYNEGYYKPKDEWERDLLESNICEYGIYEGELVPLDFPFEESLHEESDPTDGKGIGNPWQEGGGGAVYVKVGDSVKKVSFSKSGMKKKYMDPEATKSFVARHNCLSNKDKTSAAYWACRWPRYFSDSGKKWW